jgi:putative CocE/NonD family hydrolase
VKLFVMGTNRWRDETEWPLTRAVLQRHFLHADGRLSVEAPAPDEPVRTFSYDPADPVPTVGGPTYLPGLFSSQNAGPKDQRPLAGRPDILRYRSEALSSDVEVTGPLVVTIHAASSATDTDWTAKLVDVYPDGREMLIADGILRARYRDDLGMPQPIEPDRPYEYRIDLVATSNCFRAGHRIGVDVSSSNFPRFDRNPNHGGVIADAHEDDLVSAAQTVFHDADRASFIDLPIVSTTE